VLHGNFVVDCDELRGREDGVVSLAREVTGAADAAIARSGRVVKLNSDVHESGEGQRVERTDVAHDALLVSVDLHALPEADFVRRSWGFVALLAFGAFQLFAGGLGGGYWGGSGDGSRAGYLNFDLLRDRFRGGGWTHRGSRLMDLRLWTFGSRDDDLLRLGDVTWLADQRSGHNGLFLTSLEHHKDDNARDRQGNDDADNAEGDGQARARLLVGAGA